MPSQNGRPSSPSTASGAAIGTFDDIVEEFCGARVRPAEPRLVMSSPNELPFLATNRAHEGVTEVGSA